MRRGGGTWVRCNLTRIITLILYADDMVVWADSVEKLQQMLSILSARLAATVCSSRPPNPSSW